MASWRSWAVALLYAMPSLADPASYCARGAHNLCFQWAVPAASSSHPAPPPLFLRIQAPLSYSWVALGIGDDMPDSSIFVIYSNGAGNVTLSTRPGNDHVMPLYAPRSDVHLLSGSGVDTTQGLMTANIRCEDWCARLSRSGSNDWIAAWRTGGALDSKDPAAVIDQHDNHDQFAVDFSVAGSVPPITTTTGNPFMDKGQGQEQEQGEEHGGKGGEAGGGGGGGGGGGKGNGVTSRADSLETLRAAHGLLMAIVFLVLYPVGAMLMPLLGKWYLHAAWQATAFCGMWAAFAIGYTVGHRQDIFFDTTHTRLGLFAICLISIQPFTGYIHHRVFLARHARSIWSYLHIWLGRGLILLGIVNGGLGIRDRAADITVGERRRYTIAFAVVAGLVGALYVAVAVVAPRRKKGDGKEGKDNKRMASPVGMTQYD